MRTLLTLLTMVALVLAGCQTTQENSPEPTPDQLLRKAYQSEATGQEREYYVYLPDGYDPNRSEAYPVIFFLHGNGERGNGKEDLDYVLVHGPMFEAWFRHRDLPFIMVAPQLPYFGRENNYAGRPKEIAITRDPVKALPHPADYRANRELRGYAPADSLPENFEDLPDGWSRCLTDLNNMLDTVLDEYNADDDRVYLTGISYGGFGTWYWASQNPERFAAIAPIVGWGHPSLMEPIAKAQLPTWVFIGGRDNVVEEKYFYPGLNALEEAGHHGPRVTIQADMGHLAWLRVYGGSDLYDWFLQGSEFTP